MSDLISRSALLEAREYCDCPSCGDDDCDFCHISIEAVKNAPAVDAVEIGSCDGCYWKEIGRHQKCACCRRNRYLKDCYERRADDGRKEDFTVCCV